MDINKITDVLLKNQIIDSVIVIVVSYMIYVFINAFIFNNKGIQRLAIGGKNETYVNLIRNIVKYVFLIVTILIVLQINGVNVSSLLAGIGIISVVIGLALQDALKDIIKGFNILSDAYFKVGDVIKYNDIEGKVLVVGLKTTKIRDIKNQNIVAIANRNIEQVEVVSNQLDIEVPLAYGADKKKVLKALDEIVSEILKLAKVKKCNYIGINNMGDSSLDYLVRIQCEPETKYQTKRDSQVIIMDVLDKNNLEVPFKQIDIHNN